MERISIIQLFMLTLLFQLDVSVISGFASSAGRDAWLSTLISTVLGSCLILIYLTLMHLQPGLTLVEWFPAQFGRLLGTPIAWFYILFFLYNGSRTLFSVKDLISTTVLPQTPNWIILGVYLLAIMYALYGGIEAIARLAEIILPVILVLFLIEIILLFGSDTLHFGRLKPVLGEGWGRVWKAVWPINVLHSFGESLEFAMIWTLIKKQEKIMKTTLIATVSYGVILSIFDALAILAFGEGTFSSSTYPLYRLVKIISIGDFLENLDALGILYFVAIAFFKITLQLYGVIRGMQQLLYLRNSRGLILPITAIVFYLALTESKNVSEHVFSGTNSLVYPTIIPIIGIPGLLLIVAFIRKIITNNKLQKR